MANKQVCASCLNFSVDKIVKSQDKLKPTWLKDTDYVREFVKSVTTFKNRTPDNIDTSLKLKVGKRHEGKKILYWGTNPSKSHLNVIDARKAYGKFSNNGIATIDKNGMVSIKLSCPQIYRVQKTLRHKPSSFFKHFHFVLSDTKHTRWNPQLYTKIIVCNHDYEKVMQIHKKKQCLLINTLPCEYYGKDHIPRSYNLPHADIKKMSQKKLHEWMSSIVDDDYPRIARALKDGKIQIKELPIVVYCAHSKCNSSHIAAEELLKKGFVNISEYKGGMKEYNKKSKA